MYICIPIIIKPTEPELCKSNVNEALNNIFFPLQEVETQITFQIFSFLIQQLSSSLSWGTSTVAVSVAWKYLVPIFFLAMVIN